jgi:hypothetical protein
METSNSTDKIKKMILRVKLHCRLGRELYHLQSDWSHWRFIGVPDCIVGNVRHLSSLFLSPQRTKYIAFAVLKKELIGWKALRECQSKKHILVLLFDFCKRKCLDIWSAYPLRQNLRYDLNMTPYSNLKAIQRTVKDVSMSLLSGTYALNTNATFKSHPIHIFNPLIRLFPCHFPLMVKFTQKALPNACVYGRGIQYKKNWNSIRWILVPESTVILWGLKNRSVEYPTGVLWQILY